MKNTLTIYTKNNCGWCDLMKDKLSEWGYPYNVVNIQENDSAKSFIVNQEGHRTVPQLYYGKININRNVPTADLTKGLVEQYIGHLDEVK